MFDEHRIRGTFEASKEIGTKVVDWADEVFVSHHQICKSKAEYDGEEPCAYKAFDGLFGRYLDQLSAAESNTTDISEDIIGDDQRNRQKEPDHALEDIVNYEM